MAAAIAILVTTVDGRDKARDLARAALGARLAACVQIAPIESLYAWEGELREEPEFRLEMKHRAEDHDALSALVRRLHPYETPEILRLDVAAADADYAAWLTKSTERA
jgi:periplasmic divalent cation tolerance protein